MLDRPSVQELVNFKHLELMGAAVQADLLHTKVLSYGHVLNCKLHESLLIGTGSLIAQMYWVPITP